MLRLKSALNISPIFVILTKWIRKSHLQSSPFRKSTSQSDAPQMPLCPAAAAPALKRQEGVYF